MPIGYRTLSAVLAGLALATVVSVPAQALADRPDQSAAPVGVEGFGRKYGKFAGYHERVTGEVTLTSTVRVPEVEPCDGANVRLVAGSVTIFPASLTTVAAVYVTNICYGPKIFTIVELVAPGGRYFAPGEPVETGDRTKVTATVHSAGSHVAATNLSKDWSFDLDGPAIEPFRVAVGAVTGHDGEGNRLLIPDFGRLRLSNTTIGNVELDSTQVRAVDLRANTGPRMTTGPIRHGSDFTVRFRHA